jgi:hypothetical protein
MFPYTTFDYNSNLAEDTNNLLFNWGFTAGQYQTGWGTLENSIYGMATLSLTKDFPIGADELKTKLSQRLSQANAPNQEIRDRTAREIKIRAASLHNEGYGSSKIEYAMSQTKHDKMRPLLEEIANLLSPK